MNQSGHMPAKNVGMWEAVVAHLFDDRLREERKADDQRIRHMLALAPAYKPWGRRG